MTDEEKAKEWVRTNSGYSTKEFHGQKAIKAFLAGLEAGKDMAETDLATVAYMQGAESGYNKANEWHKQEVDDIYDLISEDWSVRYFICIMKDKSRVTAIGNCDEGNNGEVSVNLFFEHDDEKYYIDDIVWWKEIVLPLEEK